MAPSDIEKGVGLTNLSPQPPHPAYNTSGDNGAFLPTYEEHLNANLRSFAEPESLKSTSSIITTSSKLNPKRRRLVLQGLCILAFLLIVLGAGTALALGVKSKNDCSSKVLRPYLPLSTFPQPLRWEKRSAWTNGTQQMSNKQTRSDGTVTFHPYTTTVYVSAIAPMTSTLTVVVAPPSAKLLQPTSTAVVMVTVTSTAMVVVSSSSSSSEASVSALPFTLPTDAKTTPTPSTSASATSTSTSTASTSTSTTTSTAASETPPPAPPVTVTASPPAVAQAPTPDKSPVATASRRVGWCGVVGAPCA